MFLKNYENNILDSLYVEENVDHIKGEYYIQKNFSISGITKILFLMQLDFLRMLMR